MTTATAPKGTKSNSSLSGLRFISATRPTKADQAQRAPRAVVLEFIDQQVGLAKANIEGKNFSVSKIRFQKPADGSKARKVEVSVVPRRGYWDASGEFLANLKYGNIPIFLDGEHSAFMCGPKLEDVVKTFEIIKRAVEAGECDAQIAAAAEKAKRKKVA